MLEKSNEYQTPEIVEVGKILDVIKGEKEIYFIDSFIIEVPIWFRPLTPASVDDE